MTKEQLILLLSKEPKDVVTELQKSSFKIPAWADLEKQYDPLKHAIFDTAKYPIKQNELGQDKFKRIPLGLQKLAVKRIAQAMFAQPVDRVYSSEVESDKVSKAIELIEQIYRTENKIDSENLERGKALGATCQAATVWKSKDKPGIIRGETTKFALRHKTYSELDGYKIFAQTDDDGDLIVLTILYKDSEEKEHCYVYANLDKPAVRVYDKDGDWVLNVDKSQELAFYPVVYIPAKEPVWGGQEGTALVEAMEEMLSFEQLYIKENTQPTWALDVGDTSNMKISDITEKADDAKRIIKLGKGGSLSDVTWKGASEAKKEQMTVLRNAFFEQVQMPDSSFANLLNSNTSAANKELLFADSKANAEDLGGEWEKLFYDEMNIIKEFAKIFFPPYAKEIDSLSIRSIIRPYNIKNKKDTADYVNMAGDSMSLATKVKTLGEVDDINKEVATIEEERAASNNL